MLEDKILADKITGLLQTTTDLENEMSQKKEDAMAQLELVEKIRHTHQLHYQKLKRISLKIIIGCIVICTLFALANAYGDIKLVLAIIGVPVALVVCWQLKLFSNALHVEVATAKERTEIINKYYALYFACEETTIEFKLQMIELKSIYTMLTTTFKKHLHLLDPSPLPEEVREDVMDYLADLAESYATVKVIETDNSLSIIDLQKHLQKKEVMN